MKRSMLLLPLLASTLAACHAADQSASEATAVFGNDDRQNLSMDNPFDAVAHLDTANGGTCTAYMVAPRIGLTAGHCTEGVANGGTMTMQFRGDYGDSVSIRLLERGSNTYTGNNYDDWAIFVIKGTESNQWLGYTSEVLTGHALHLSGYSTDLQGATTTDHCSARLVSGSVIYHDCDMQGGASGGPIFRSINNSWYAVGIQSGHYANGQAEGYHPVWTISNSNLGAKLTPALVQRISEYKALYPAGTTY